MIALWQAHELKRASFSNFMTKLHSLSSLSKLMIALWQAHELKRASFSNFMTKLHYLSSLSKLMIESVTGARAQARRARGDRVPDAARQV